MNTPRWRMLVVLTSLVSMVAVLASLPPGVAQNPTCKAKIKVFPGIIEGVEFNQSSQTFDDAGQFNTHPLVDSRQTVIRVYLEQDPPGCATSLNVDGWLSSESSLPVLLTRADDHALVPATGSKRSILNSTLNFTMASNFYSEGHDGGGLGSFKVCVSHFDFPPSPVPPPTTASDIDGLTIWDDCSETLTIPFKKPCGVDIVAVPIDSQYDGLDIQEPPQPITKGPPHNRVGPPRGASMVFAAHPVPILSERMRYRWSTEHPPTDPKVINYRLYEEIWNQGFLACQLASVRNFETPPAEFMFGWLKHGVTGPVNSNWGRWCVLAGRGAIGVDREPSFQRTFKHEMHHEFNQHHEAVFLDIPGFDVLDYGENPESNPKFKPVTTSSLRWPLKNTNETWIAGKDYLSMVKGSDSYENHFKCRDLPTYTKVRLPIIVHDESGGIEIQPVFTIDNYIEPLPQSTLGNVALRLRDSMGVVQYTHMYTSTAETVMYNAITPAYTDTQTIEILENGILKDVITRTTASPIITITNPISGSLLDNTTNISWEASDADGDDLLYVVQYSHDGGTRWLPIATLTSATTKTLQADILPSSISAMIRVIATDGLNSTTATVGGLVLLPNRSPSIDIINPKDDAVYRQGANITMMALVQELEDEFVQQSSVSWSSDIDGVIGDGSIVNTALLSVGNHTITVSATDSGSKTTTSSVDIVVQ